MENAFELNDEENVVIFPATYSPIDFSRDSDDERFTPSKEDVTLAENALVNDLKRMNWQKCGKFLPLIHENLANYGRQYFGYIDNNGDRILFINCLWKKHEKSDSWLNEQILVLDGGSYYWNIKFNLNKKQLFSLMINGSS